MTGLVIETERLELCPASPEHFEAFAEFQASARAAERGWLMDRNAAWGHWCQRLGEWSMNGWGWWTMVRRTDKAFIGFTGLMYPPAQPEIEIGWTIWDNEAEGYGYAFEGAVALRAYAFGTLGLATLVSYIDPGNLRSIRLAERLDASRDGKWTTPSGKEVIVFRHPRPEATA